MTIVDGLEVKDAKTFAMKLKSPTGLVLLGLGKPSSNVPFMMPKRVADTDPNSQISDFTGSGPFIFKRDEWKPGDKTVYVKNANYKPRSEPASGLAGGKVVKVDRVEWRANSDHHRSSTRCSRRDRLHERSHDCCRWRSPMPTSSTWIGTRPAISTPSVRTGCMPFDNPKVREARSMPSTRGF
jgi:peptide/nickel transport system substrate-binding protein